MPKRNKHNPGRSAVPVSKAPDKANWDFILGLILFGVVALANLPLSQAELMSPDASGYLDMGRNIFSGKGFVISYNLNQFWQGQEHPSLPYMHPLYPILAGALWSLFQSVIAVIQGNILLWALNCVLVFGVLRFCVDRWTALVACLFLGFARGLVFTALFPWTEQLHLFLLLAAVWLNLRFPRSQFWVGLVLGFSFLARAGGLYSILAFGVTLVLLRGSSKEALAGYGKAALGLLLVVGGYEVMCLLLYHAAYPQYAGAAAGYWVAEHYPGASYSAGIPALKAPVLHLTGSQVAANIRESLWGSFKALGLVNAILVSGAAFFLYRAAQRVPAQTDVAAGPRNTTIHLLTQGGFVLFANCAAHWRGAMYEFDRFTVIPYVMLSCLGFVWVADSIRLAGEARRKQQAGRILFFGFAAVMILFQLKEYLPFRTFYLDHYPTQQAAYRSHRDEIHAWIRSNAKPKALIASNYLTDPFYHERPFVSLPPDKAFTAKNMDDYLAVFKPDYVLTGNQSLIPFLLARGFEEKARSGDLVLLGTQGSAN